MQAPVTSVEELLDRVAQRAYSLSRAPAPEVEPDGYGTRVIHSERAPGLTDVIRRVWSPGSAVELVIDFHQPVGDQSEAISWSAVKRHPSLRRYRAFKKSVKVYVRTGGLPAERRNPWQKADRAANRWRFSSDGRPPSERLIERLRQQGKEDDAARLQKSFEDLHPGVHEARRRREARYGRVLWFDPHRQTAEDIRFLLALILAQERMIGRESPIHSQAVRYLTSLLRVEELIAGRVWVGLSQYFDSPEDSRAFRAYACQLVRAARDGEKSGWGTGGQTLAQEREDDADRAGDEEDAHTGAEGDQIYDEALRDARQNIRREPRDRKQRIPVRLHSDETKQTFTIREADEWLMREGPRVSPATLYRWIAAGEVPAFRRKGQWHLSLQTLALMQQRAQDWPYRRAARKALIASGRSPAAAKKLIQRRHRAGSPTRKFSAGSRPTPRQIATPHRQKGKASDPSVTRAGDRRGSH